MFDTNPETYSVALAGYPQHRFTIGQAVRPRRRGLASDPGGYEHNYRSGDAGVVETLSADGYHVGVRFTDGGFCIYIAHDVEVRR